MTLEEKYKFLSEKGLTEEEIKNILTNETVPITAMSSEEQIKAKK